MEQAKAHPRPQAMVAPRRVSKETEARGDATPTWTSFLRSQNVTLWRHLGQQHGRDIFHLLNAPPEEQMEGQTHREEAVNGLAVEASPLSEVIACSWLRSCNDCLFLLAEGEIAEGN